MFAYILLGCALIGCGSNNEPQVHSPVIEKDAEEWPTHEVWEVHTEFRDSGSLRAQLTATKAKIFEPQARTLLSGGFRLVIPNEGDTTVLVADSAVINDKTKDMTAFGDVVVTGTDRKISTDKIHWSNVDKLFTSDAPVEIRTPHQRIVGVGFQATERLTEYSVYKVTGTHTIQQ